MKEINCVIKLKRMKMHQLNSSRLYASSRTSKTTEGWREIKHKSAYVHLKSFRWKIILSKTRPLNPLMKLIRNRVIDCICLNWLSFKIWLRQANWDQPDRSMKLFKWKIKLYIFPHFRFPFRRYQLTNGATCGELSYLLSLGRVLR